MFKKTFNALLSSVSRFIPYFNCRRMATASVTNSEYLSLMGISFSVEIDVTIPEDGDVWYKFVAPPDRDVQILTRDLSPDIAGAEYNLYISATGLVEGAVLPARRTNPTTGVPSTSSVKLLTAAPTNPGVYTTPIFIGKGGASNANGRPGGTDSGKSGLTSYGRGTGFVARIHNSSGASNRVVFRLEFAEVNNDLLKGIYA